MCVIHNPSHAIWALSTVSSRKTRRNVRQAFFPRPRTSESITLSDFINVTLISYDVLAWAPFDLSTIFFPHLGAQTTLQNRQKRELWTHKNPSLNHLDSHPLIFSVFKWTGSSVCKCVLWWKNREKKLFLSSPISQLTLHYFFILNSGCCLLKRGRESRGGSANIMKNKFHRVRSE